MGSSRQPETSDQRQSFGLVSERRYRRLLFVSVLLTSLVAIIPLVLMTGVNYYQYQYAVHVESQRPMARFTTNAKLSLESFLSERLAALSLVTQTEALEELRDSDKLDKLLSRMKRSFGGFIDLGVIDPTGRQVSYAGPYQLRGKRYDEQAWFHEVRLRGVHVSEVFLGHRHLPHFVIAVSFDTPTGDKFVLRTAIDSDKIVRRIQSLSTHPSNDTFIINRSGILQTPSRRYGKVLQRIPIDVPPESGQAEVIETTDGQGKPLVIGYAYIDRSPFVVMLTCQSGALQESWLSLRRDLLLFLALSVALILAVVFLGSRYMVNRARQADLTRASLYHKMEYTNKMAAIGRLAAGVAHEINNPLAIINQKAGLHKDLLSLSDELPPKEKMIALVDAVLESVDRCSAITHRLLGFAKHMDVRREDIDLALLIRGVLGFLEKEADYRSLTVSTQIGPDVPTIQSDRGQLQQVFLNIINNAFAAVDDAGHIDIAIERVDDQHVSVSVTDNGVGIASDNLRRIFEPFFTTKKGAGTGLGLSITYGIVQKLGGQIKVSSDVGQGTCFTVTLPVSQQ